MSPISSPWTWVNQSSRPCSRGRRVPDQQGADVAPVCGRLDAGTAPVEREVRFPCGGPGLADVSVAVVSAVGEHEHGGVKRTVEADPVDELAARTVEISEPRHEPVDNVEALVLVHMALAIGNRSQAFVEAGRVTREGVPTETGPCCEPDSGRVGHRFGLDAPFRSAPGRRPGPERA